MCERREEEENSCICAVNGNEGKSMEVGEDICLGCPKVTSSPWLTRYQLLLEHLRTAKPVNTMVLVDIWDNSGLVELKLPEAASSMWGQTGQLQAASDRTRDGADLQLFCLWLQFSPPWQLI